jgi:hypothetical protein
MIEVVQSRTSRRRAKSRQRANAPETEAAEVVNPKGESVEIKPAPKMETPVVDIPVSDDQSSEIKEFITAHHTLIKEYITKNFGEDCINLVDPVCQEVAECFILKRTAKSSESWDLDVIEDIIAEVEKVERLAKKDEKLEKIEQKEEKPKLTKKVAPETPDVPAVPVDVNKEQFIAIAQRLRKSKEIWLQAQDVDAVVDYLWDVHQGTKTITKEGVKGKGTRTYGQVRCKKIINAIQKLMK